MIASLGPVGAAFAAAFPILALVILAEKIGEFITKIKEARAEAEKLADSQLQFSTSVNNVYDSLDERLLQAGIKMDDLNDNHASALQKEIALIDKTEMKDLVRQFDILGKAADAVFANLKAHWYEQGEGSLGAEHALKEFQLQYDNLLSQGKKKEAGDLLGGTLESAQKVLALQKQAIDNQYTSQQHAGNYNKYVEANVKLTEMGVGHTEKEVKAQQQLVDTLQATVDLRKKEAEVADADKAIKVKEEELRLEKEHDAELKRMSKDQQTDAKIAEEEQDKRNKEEIAAVKDSVDAQLAATAKGSTARLAIEAAALARLKAEHLEWTEYYKELQNKLTEDTRAAAQARVAALEAEVRTQDKLTESVGKTADEQIKAAAKTAETTVKGAASIGVISKREELEQLISIYNQEAAALAAKDAKELIETQTHVAQLKALAADLPEGSPAQIQAMHDVEVEQAKINQLTEQAAHDQDNLKNNITQTQLELQKLGLSWQDYFTRMGVETQQLGQQITQNLQMNMTKAVDGFSQGISKMIVEGKSLGQAMKNVAAQILESMISMLVKWVAQWIISHTIMAAFGQTTAQTSARTQGLAAAGLAGANMTASWAAAPWPIDAAAPAMGAAAAEEALGFVAFDKGGMSEGGPALLHPREAVLNPTQTAGFQKMTENAAKGAGNNITFSPVVHVHGDFDTDQHFPEIWSAFEKKVGMMGGVNI
jgi:hypothetical protein